MKHLTACIVAAAFFTLLTSGCGEPCTTCNTGGGNGGGSGGGTGAGGGSGGGNLGTGGGTTGNITVTGRVTYDFVPATLSGGSAALDFGRASQRPVRRGVVQVLQGTTVLSATATGGDGSFSISYTPNGTANLDVTLQASGDLSDPHLLVAKHRSQVDPAERAEHQLQQQFAAQIAKVRCRVGHPCTESGPTQPGRRQDGAITTGDAGFVTGRRDVTPRRELIE